MHTKLCGLCLLSLLSLFPPGPCFAQSDKPSPRADQNSLTAHAQLLDKAKSRQHRYLL